MRRTLDRVNALGQGRFPPAPAHPDQTPSTLAASAVPGAGSFQKPSREPSTCRRQKERIRSRRRSQSNPRKIFGCFKDSVPDLFRCFHSGIDRINHTHEDSVIGFGMLLNDLQKAGTVLFAG
jgi:hypothetical protein